jgi:hypothetical protein
MMPVADPADPIENVEHAVACVRAAPRDRRKSLIRDLLRGEIDYSTTLGAAIGERRARLCTRLREEDLWPA